MTVNRNKTLDEKIKETLARRGVKYPFAPVEQKPIIRRRQQPVNNIAKPMGSHKTVYVPPAPPVTDSTVYVTGGIAGISGYDNFVYEIVKGLHSLGVDVRINRHCNINMNVCPSYFSELHHTRNPDSWEITIMPPCNLDRFGPSKRTIVYTMWETDTLDPFWVKQLNNAAMVVVPSQWAVDCFKRCGVSVPIHKIPLGYDQLVFNPGNNLPEVFTFGTAAALGSGGLRKNTGRIMEIFQAAFPNNEPVRLKVKVTPHCQLPEPQDPRIQVVRTFLPPHELAEWYRSIDTFINMSFAEGFGLHLIETMACGRPIISTRYSAVTEYFDDSVGWVVDHEIIPAKGGAYSGFWASPKEESVIDKMREAFNNRHLITAKGERAFLRARNFTWKNTGQTLYKLLSESGVIK